MRIYDTGYLEPISVLSQQVSVLSQAVSVISQAVSAMSQTISVLSQAVSVLSQAVSVLSQAHSALSQQVSVLSSQVSTISVAVTSVDTRVNTVSQQVSVLSQALSVLSQAVSVLSAAGGGGGQTVFRFRPTGAVFPTDNFPQLLKVAGTNWTYYALAYDQTSAEAAYWFDAIATSVPSFTSATAEIHFETSVTTGDFGVNITTLTRAAAEVLDTAGVTNSAVVSVPGTAFQVGRVSVDITTTGWAAGELLMVKIARAVESDNAAGDIRLLHALIRLK